MISNSTIVDDPAADAAAMQASAALLQAIPDEGAISEAPPAKPPETPSAPTPEAPKEAPPAPAAEPPAPPAVAAPSGLDNVQELATSRLRAMEARRAARKGALPPPAPVLEDKKVVDPAAALSFDIIEEAKRRGVDPRELALAAVNRVKNPDGTAPWKPSGIMSEVEQLKQQLQEQKAEQKKLMEDLHLAGEKWAQDEESKKVQAWEGQLAQGVRAAISNDEMRKQFPHVALKNPDWVGGVAIAAFRAAQENNRALTAQQFFAGLESELKADADTYRPLYENSATASVAPAPAGAAPGVAPAVSKAEPKSPPVAPQTQSAPGSTFKVPPELSNFRFRPDDDPAAIAEAVAFLQVSSD